MTTTDDPLTLYRDLRWVAVMRRKQVTAVNAGTLRAPEHVAEAMVTLMVSARDKAVAARRALYRS